LPAVAIFALCSWICVSIVLSAAPSSEDGDQRLQLSGLLRAGRVETS
jgi:hypothetical protein